MGYWKKNELEKFRSKVKLEKDEEILFSLWGKLKSPDDFKGRSGVLSILTPKYLRFFRHGSIRDSINLKIPFNCIKKFTKGESLFSFVLEEILPGHFDYLMDQEEPNFIVEDFYKELKKYL